MKLQNLIIIFIIIIIPIIFMFSYYLELEADTIRIQTDYDEKLIEATKEAVEAFEINTIEWNSEYSTLANSKRRDILSSVNVFTSGLASKMGIGGTAKEYILNYVPAIVYIMYDGYYIYTPTHVPQTINDESGRQFFYYETSPTHKITVDATQIIDGQIIAGERMYQPLSGVQTKTVEGKTFTTNINDAQKIYKHVLKTFVPYASTYTATNGKKYVINYTLDNYIRIIGEDETREGYILDRGKPLSVKHNQVNLPTSLVYNHNEIFTETLEENIPVYNSASGQVEVNSYKYIYNSNNEKRYYDGKFFIINNEYKKVYLPEVEANHQVAEFKKLLIIKSYGAQEFVELYQLLNKQDGKWYIKDNQGIYSEYTEPLDGTVEFDKDCSAINYYVEMYCFNKWLNNQIGATNKYSLIDDREEKIIENINNNLQLSIANYSANSSINYKLPVITATDWEQAISNVSVITFFQGIKIGLKTYNNYSIVTSSENNEYISENSLYYYDISFSDKYYHEYGCSEGESYVSKAYLNIDFKAQTYTLDHGTDDEADDETYVYYKHFDINNALSPCFKCIVNKNTMIVGQDFQGYDEHIHLALARERYIKMGRTKLFSY